MPLVTSRLTSRLICARAVLVLALFAPSAHAQFAMDDGQIGNSGAMRAPLNIVPPVMQSVLGRPPLARPESQKLAPRVAARQSKRAVRAVTAAPGSTGDIVQVGQLGALQDAPIGLEDGFGSNLWRGARLAFITGQMARLPERLEMSALREAELTLYRSTTSAPVGTVDGTSWYAARLNRFLSLGDTASVLQIEALTGGAAQDAYAAQAVVLANLGRGNPAAACETPLPKRGQRGHADTSTFFMQLLVYCQLRIGEFEKAGLTLELNEKTLLDDRFFRELAFLMAAQAQPVFGTQAQVEAAKEADQELPLIVPSEVTPMQLALLQLAGHGLVVPLDKLPPYFAVALANDYAQPTAVQLGAAHMALRAGSLTSERFSQMSQLADLSAYRVTLAATSGSVGSASEGVAVMDEKAPDAVFLADALLRVDMATVEDQPMALADALRDAHDRGLWSDMVLVLDDRLKALSRALSTAAQMKNDLGQDGLPQADPILVEAVSASAATSNVNNAVPIMSEDDKAVLVPAYLALTGKALIASEALGDEASFETGLVARLIGYDAINDPARDPLGDLLAGLSARTPTQPLEGIADTPADVPTSPPNDDENSLSDLASLADGELSDAAAPADTRVHPIADWQAFESRFETANAALQAYMTREVAVYQGLGFEVPTDFQIASGAKDGADMRMNKLAENQWVGDLLLGLVTQYAPVSASTISIDETVTVLSILRRAGLNETAHKVGSEILLTAAARLSVLAPQSFRVEPR